MRSFALIVLCAASTAFAPPIGFQAVFDFHSPAVSATSVVRFDRGGWTNLGDIGQRFSASTATDAVFVGTKGQNPTTEFWNFAMAPTPLLIRKENLEYDALAPFSSQEVVAYSRARGLELLTPQATYRLADASDLLQPLYDVSLARVGPDQVLLFGTTDSSLALPGTLLQYRVQLVKVVGGGHGTVVLDIATSDVPSARPPLLGAHGAIFVEADKSSGGQRLTHVSLLQGTSQFPMLHAVRTGNLSDRLLPLALMRNNRGWPSAVYFRDGKALGRIELATGSTPVVADADFFSPSKLVNVSSGWLSGFVHSFAGIATYLPPPYYLGWPSWGHLAVSQTPGSTTISMPTTFVPATTITSGPVGSASNPQLLPMPQKLSQVLGDIHVPRTATLAPRFEELWKTAHDKGVLRIEKPAALFAAGDLVQILEQLQIESEWLDIALRQLGRAKYEPLGIVYRNGWSAPSYGTPIVLADFLTLVAEAKSCGGLLDEK